MGLLRNPGKSLSHVRHMTVSHVSIYSTKENGERGAAGGLTKAANFDPSLPFCTVDAESMGGGGRVLHEYRDLHISHKVIFNSRGGGGGSRIVQQDNYFSGGRLRDKAAKTKRYALW